MGDEQRVERVTKSLGMISAGRQRTASYVPEAPSIARVTFRTEGIERTAAASMRCPAFPTGAGSDPLATSPAERAAYLARAETMLPSCTQ